MAFNNRDRKSAGVSVEEFVAGAEPATQSTRTVKERAELRAAGKRVSLYTVRGTEKQDKLIKYAAERLHISQNEVYLRYVLGPLEEEFGADLPIE